MRKRIYHFGLKASIWAICMLPLSGFASDALTVNGFVAQGIQRATQTNFVNDDGDTTLEMTELGINARYQLSEQLSVNGQLVYLNAGQRYPEGIRIDYMFIDWHAIATAKWNLNVHLGRYKNYHWLYSATRDVPHTRPGNVLPQSIYFDSFRDVALGSDGIALRANTANQWGDWEINWSYGRSPIGKDSTHQLFGDLATGDIDQEYAHQASIYWRSFNSNWLLGGNLLDSDFTYHSGPNDFYGNGVANVQRVSLVAQWQSQYWELTSEIMRESSQYKDVVFPGFFSDSIAEGGYLQLTVMPKERIMGLVRVDLYDLNREDRNGNVLTAQSNGVLPNYFAYADSATIGLRYDIMENLAVNAEYSRARGAGRLTPLLAKNSSAAKAEYWDFWSVQLMYWF
ncbi:TonB-dependent receptor [Alteromonas facilis]|uniref:TonB-dependent receptor n=1 Tax=Alteromonas facilis TaxID=2048004 RepID=UPI000F5D35EA|nr:TonB-dependent receptor [Alteromonas facilis]